MPGFFDSEEGAQGFLQPYDVVGQGGSQALQQAYRSGAYNLEDPVPLVSAGLPPQVWRVPGGVQIPPPGVPPLTVGLPSSGGISAASTGLPWWIWVGVAVLLFKHL